MSLLGCTHRVTTPADDDGRVVCTDCGLVLAPALTREEFDRAAAQLECAPHTLDCVRIDGEWFCPPACPAPRR